MTGNYVVVNEQDSKLITEFNDFLNSEVNVWAEKLRLEILNNLSKSVEGEQTVMRTLTVENHEAFNNALGKKMCFADLELRDEGMNMYWNGKLKLKFNAKVSYYNKNAQPFKKYYMKVSLPTVVKLLVERLEFITSNDDITIIVDGQLYDGNGNRTTIYFDNLNEEFIYESDCDYVLRFISLNLTYVKSK